jgi:hypothetical protein
VNNSPLTADGLFASVADLVDPPPPPARPVLRTTASDAA